jgi:hypothetical protein
MVEPSAPLGGNSPRGQASRLPPQQRSRSASRSDLTASDRPRGKLPDFPCDTPVRGKSGAQMLEVCSARETAQEQGR